jgi:hypothetical protein
MSFFRWESGSKEGLFDVIIDPEWGAFGDNGCIHFIKTGRTFHFTNSDSDFVNFSMAWVYCIVSYLKV